MMLVANELHLNITQVITLVVSVHEIALKRNLQVHFEVVREAGPPHMRTFLTKVIVGDFVTEGEGNGKKVSERIDYFLK